MIQSFGELNVHAYEPHCPETVQLTQLFAHEELRAEMVFLPPGAQIALHRHENAHELFDVVQGQGKFVVDGVEFPGGPGKCVLVRAGTSHSICNDGEEPWMIRVTYQERIYPRHIGKLVGRAIRKRLGLIS